MPLQSHLIQPKAIAGMEKLLAKVEEQGKAISALQRQVSKLLAAERAANK